MKRFLSIFCALIFAQSLAMAANVRWENVELKHNGGDDYELTLNAEIAKEWKMYDMQTYKDGPNPTTFRFSQMEGVELVGEMMSQPAPTRKWDDLFAQEIGFYEGTVTFTQRLRATSSPSSLSLGVEYMTCSGMMCTPPEDYDFGTVVLKEQSDASSLWLLIVEAVLWGFAALLTPCVFPMVPLTVSFFLKQSESPVRGRFMALLYGVFIVALYTLPIAAIIFITYLFGGDAVMVDIFNWIATHWLPNIIFFIVFVVFAASFFGAFELSLPSKWVNKTDENASVSSLGGVFFLALTLVLVSFSCTGPIVGSVLIKSTSGAFWEPVVTMLAFSVAFALPFLAVAFFPSLIKTLPRSGGWLSSVKVVLGFLELALGLKFLSVADQTYQWGLLDREIYLALWIAIFSLLGLYLLGKLRFAHEAKVETLSFFRLLLSLVVFSFVIYLVPGMWGAPLKALSGYLPPIETQDFRFGGGSGVAPQMPQIKGAKPFVEGLSAFSSIDEAQAYANEVNKPLFVDLTGYGCVNCREMEQKVWSDARVKKILAEEFVIVALYMDDKRELPESEWVTTPEGRVLKTVGRVNSRLALQRFGVNAQPYYIVLDREGRILIEPQGYMLDVEKYIDFLNKGIKAYKDLAN